MPVENWLKKYNEMNEKEREIERLKRNINNLDLTLKNLTSQLTKLINENNYLKKEEKIFITLKTNIKMAVEKYKSEETKPGFYDMFYKLDQQLDKEMEIVNETKNISN